MQTGGECGINKCSVARKPECSLIILMNVLTAAEFLMSLVCKQRTYIDKSSQPDQSVFFLSPKPPQAFPNSKEAL